MTRGPVALNSSDRQTLYGKRIAVTRTREQAGVFRDQLTALGAEVIEIATIEIRDPASWEPLDSAIRRLEDFDYVLLTSANGVRSFLRRLKACGRDVGDLKGVIIGAIGPATAAELSKSGPKADVRAARIHRRGSARSARQSRPPRQSFPDPSRQGGSGRPPARTD